MARKRSGGVERTTERQLRDLPEGIPWIPLGLDAERYYIVDGDGLLRALPRDRAGHMLMLGIHGAAHQDWAFYNYARWRKIAGGELERVPRSLQPELIGQDVGLLCGLKGAFDPAESVHDTGAWLGEDSDLILHCGDHLWIRGARCETGLRGRWVYPRRAPILAPHDAPVDGTVGREVLVQLARWRLGRYIDAQLLLGLLGLGMLAGAMAHRPNILLVGEHASGKTGLLEFFKQILGRRMLLTPDATPAGITQRVGLSNMLIGLDEREAGDDPRRDSGLLTLLRACYTGGESLRGGQAHVGVAFKLYCAVLAAAIIPPAMDAADRSRNVIITVKGPPEARRLRLAYDARLELMGVQLLRRLADHWKRLQLDVIPACERVLREIGFDGRGADTIGTLLSISWVLREDGALTQEGIDGLMTADLNAMLREEQASRQKSYDKFVGHVLGLSYDPMRKGEWRTVLEWLHLAAGYGSTPEAARRVESEAIRIAKTDEAALDAQRQLSRIGLRAAPAADGSGERVLLFANQSAVLAEMLKNTQWAGLPGRTSPWSQLLLRVPGACSVDCARFACGVSRAVELPLGWVLRGVVGPDPEAERAFWDAEAANA